MYIKEFARYTSIDELTQGFALYENKVMVLKNRKDGLYHFDDGKDNEVKIIMENDKILYAYCDCEIEQQGYCAHEVACFLSLIHETDPEYDLEEVKDFLLENDELNDEVYDDYQELIDNDEFELADFLSDKSKEELLWIISMMDTIDPELGLLIFRLYYDEIMKK